MWDKWIHREKGEKIQLMNDDISTQLVVRENLSRDIVFSYTPPRESREASQWYSEVIF